MKRRDKGLKAEDDGGGKKPAKLGGRLLASSDMRTQVATNKLLSSKSK